MSLITRQGKGEKLTVQEMDGNLEYLEGLSQATELGVAELAADLQAAVPYRAYRAKIAMQLVDWPGYGYLYNWYAVDDARQLENPAGGTGLTAPNEWRVPSDGDWNTLRTFAGGSSVAGGKLKSKLTSNGYPGYGWFDNGGGTDDYNFGALGGGIRQDEGTLLAIASVGYWWATTSTSPLEAFSNQLTSISDTFNLIITDKRRGYSVRLVREATAGELLLTDGDTSDTSSLDSYTGNDGTEYVTVKIGTQIWLAQNLRETLYNNSDPIFNAASNIPFGGDGSNTTWEAKGVAQEGAWTVFMLGFASPVQYDPTIIKLFYNEVLENTVIRSGISPTWIASSDINGPIYRLEMSSIVPWNKTHIKITSGYDVSDFPTINEKSLLIERAVEGEADIRFRPIKKDGTTGAITIEDLNNYNDGDSTSYVYVEILEYLPASYYNGMLGIGVNNL